MSANYNRLNIATIIIGVSMSTAQLSGCHSADILGIPRMDIENHLGDSQIAKVLEDANVTTGNSIYHGHSAFSHIDQHNTKLYNTILTAIDNAKQKPMPLNEALNNSNLGVVCHANQCRYQGYFINKFSYMPNDKLVGSKSTQISNVIIAFDPNKLSQTYDISITTTESLSGE